MGYFNKFKNYVMNRGNKRNMQDLVVILVIGLIIVIAANFFMPPAKISPGYVEVNTDNSKAASTNAVNTGSYEGNLKQELISILSQIDGAGNVDAMIYYNSGSESVPAFNYNDSTKVTEEDDGNGGKRVTNEDDNSVSIVTTNDGGGTQPFITKEIKPKVCGVIVIAEGADNPDIRYKLYEAVKTLFNMDDVKVNIYPMQKNK